jgi:hypothetical protein
MTLAEVEKYFVSKGLPSSSIAHLLTSCLSVIRELAGDIIEPCCTPDEALDYLTQRKLYRGQRLSNIRPRYVSQFQAGEAPLVAELMGVAAMMDFAGMDSKGEVE